MNAHEQAALEEARIDWLADMDATVIYKGFTRGDLNRIFDRVKNPADWKAPILATCPGEAVLALVAAIEFFTATAPTVSLDVRTMTYVVESEGYRNGPAGDH